VAEHGPQPEADHEGDGEEPADREAADVEAFTAEGLDYQHSEAGERARERVPAERSRPMKVPSPQEADRHAGLRARRDRRPADRFVVGHHRPRDRRPAGGKRLRAVRHGQQFWFALAAFLPDARIVSTPR